MAIHSSILAWRIPQTENAGWPQSVGQPRVGQDRATNTHTQITGREHSPTHQQKIGMKIYRTWPRSSDPVSSSVPLSHQEASISLLSSEGRQAEKLHHRKLTNLITWTTVQLSSVTQSYPTHQLPHESQLTRPPVHHQLPEFTQTHVHRIGDAFQPSHPLSSPSPSVPNPSQHPSLFQ